MIQIKRNELLKIVLCRKGDYMKYNKIELDKSLYQYGNLSKVLEKITDLEVLLEGLDFLEYQFERYGIRVGDINKEIKKFFNDDKTILLLPEYLRCMCKNEDQWKQLLDLFNYIYKNGSSKSMEFLKLINEGYTVNECNEDKIRYIVSIDYTIGKTLFTIANVDINNKIINVISTVEKNNCSDRGLVIALKFLINYLIGDLMRKYLKIHKVGIYIDPSAVSLIEEINKSNLDYILINPKSVEDL